MVNKKCLAASLFGVATAINPQRLARQNAADGHSILSKGSSVLSEETSFSRAESTHASGTETAAGAGAGPVTSATESGSMSMSSSMSTTEAASQYSPLPYSYNEELVGNVAAASTAASIANIPVSEIPGHNSSVQPVISSAIDASHGLYTGPEPTITGALSNSANGTAIPTLPPNPMETVYNPNGTLNSQQPIPYQPAGGLGTNGTEPVYRVQSDFDYQSILLGLYQEWIELDLFHDIKARFSKEEFEAAGLTESDQWLIEFMAEQESGHATLLSNLLGGPGGATPMCSYNYPYTTVYEAFDFAQKLTRWGESGVWGFQAHLDSREVAQVLGQSIATEARQQVIFRQFSGLSPMPVWFEAGIPQSWAWTYLAPYISSCPANSKRLAWQNFPQLTVLNQPNINLRNGNDTQLNDTVGWGAAAPSNSQTTAGDSCVGTNQTGYDCSAAISQNRSIPLSYPGKMIYLEWEEDGLPVGPNNSYITAGSKNTPKYVMWVNQLNVTYSPLTNFMKVPQASGGGTSSNSTGSNSTAPAAGGASNGTIPVGSLNNTTAAGAADSASSAGGGTETVTDTAGMEATITNTPSMRKRQATETATDTAGNPATITDSSSSASASETGTSGMTQNGTESTGGSGPQKYTGQTYQPLSMVFEGDMMINGTMFVALVDEMVNVTPFNLSMINPHVVALGLYQAG